MSAVSLQWMYNIMKKHLLASLLAVKIHTKYIRGIRLNYAMDVNIMRFFLLVPLLAVQIHTK